MRLLPAQIGVRLICGDSFAAWRIAAGQDLKSRIKFGHDWLVSLSGKDFGYDLVAWHEYLKESRDGGYTWGRNVVLPRIMKSALASEEWQAAVREITTPAKSRKAKRPR